jgi:hypothetical protein
VGLPRNRVGFVTTESPCRVTGTGLRCSMDLVPTGTTADFKVTQSSGTNYTMYIDLTVLSQEPMSLAYPHGPV